MQIAVQVEGHIAAFRNLKRVFDCSRHFSEQPPHLTATLHEKLIAPVFHPVGIAHHGGGLKADHTVVGLGVLRVQIMNVVAADHGQIQAFRDFENAPISRSLLLKPVVLQFEVESARTENFAEFAGGLCRAVDGPMHTGFGDFALQTGGQTDDAL